MEILTKQDNDDAECNANFGDIPEDLGRDMHANILEQHEEVSNGLRPSGLMADSTSQFNVTHDGALANIVPGVAESPTIPRLNNLDYLGNTLCLDRKAELAQLDPPSQDSNNGTKESTPSFLGKDGNLMGDFFSNQVGMLHRGDAGLLMQALQTDIGGLQDHHGVDLEERDEGLVLDSLGLDGDARRDLRGGVPSQLLGGTGGNVSVRKNKKNRKKKKNHEKESIKDSIEAGIEDLTSTFDGADPGLSSEGEDIESTTATTKESQIMLRRSIRFRRPSSRVKHMYTSHGD